MTGRLRCFVVVATLAMGGCPYVPAGEVRVERGALPVEPGATVSFSLYCDALFGGWELTSGPEHCGRNWMVQGQVGGSDALGIIDDCGEYHAPLARPAEPIDIIATECPWGDDCTDACGGSITLDLDAYPAP